MRRQLGRLARAVAFVSDDASMVALRQQGALSGAPASTAAATAGKARSAALSTAAAAMLRPVTAPAAAAAAARLAALQLPYPARTISSTAGVAAGPGFDAGLPEEAAAGVPTFSSAQDAAEYVQENIHTLRPAGLGAVVQQLVEMHMGQLSHRGGRKEASAALEGVIATVLAEDSPLRNVGSAVSWLLWGAAKLRLRPSDEDKQALLAAAERCVGNARAKNLAAMLWGLGWLHLNPSQEYWQTLGDRLFGEENLAQYLRVPDLIPALSGISVLPETPKTLADLLMQDLQMKANQMRAREVGGIANFLPAMPHTQHRDELAEKVFNQAARLAPHMDLVGISSLLWGAAKLGTRPEDDTVRALLESSQEKLSDNRGHAVPGLLWALGKMGFRAGDGVVTEGFVRECIDAQMATLERRVQPQKITKFLNACGMVRVNPTEEQVEACFNSIVEQDFFQMEEHGLRSLLRALQGFRYWKGVDIMKEKLGIERERPQRYRRQRGQQGQGQQQAQQQQLEGEGEGAAQPEVV